MATNNIHCHSRGIVIKKMKAVWPINYSVKFIDQAKNDTSCIISVTRQKFFGHFTEDTTSQQYALQRYQYFS